MRIITLIDQLKISENPGNQTEMQIQLIKRIDGINKNKICINKFYELWVYTGLGA